MAGGSHTQSRLVDELLVVRNDALRNGLAQRVDLGGVAAALDAEADVHLVATLLAEEQQRLVDLSIDIPASCMHTCMVDGMRRRL